MGQNQASFVDMQCKESNLCMKRSSHKLAIQKVRIATCVDTINISTPQAVTYMGRLLGLSLLVGVRKKFPTVSSGTTYHLSVADTVNVVDVRAEKNSGDGLYLRFDYHTKLCAWSNPVQ